MSRCLEIGPGAARLSAEWVTVDCVSRPGVVDHVARWGAEPLPFPDESFDVVYAAHVLEHVPWHQTLDALREAARVLACGGRVELHVPDLDVLLGAVAGRFCGDVHAEQGLNDELHWMHWTAERLFHLGPEENWHRACFNAEHLRWCLTRSGFEEIEFQARERGGDHGRPNLGVVARKPAAAGTTGRVLPTDAHARPTTSRPAARTARRDSLPPCHARRELSGKEDVFFCAHPRVFAPRQLVTPEICAGCARAHEPPPDEYRPFRSALGARFDGPCWYWGEYAGVRPCATCRGRVLQKVHACEHPQHDYTTAQECVKCADYEPRLKRGSVRDWAVGVTTAPRAVGALPTTLASLAAAGFSAPRVFAEPDSPLPGHVAPESVTWRSTKLGAWSNFYLALSELCQRAPHADAYLLVQDDVLFCRNLRPYLEQVLWPAARLGVVTLYNPGRPGEHPPGLAAVDSRDGLPGALALAWPNYAARQFLSDPRVLAHRRRGDLNGTRLVDVVVGQWADRAGLPAYAHAPSLVQHIGDHTTIWGASEDVCRRRAPTFAGESFDALTLLDAGAAG